MAAKRSSRRCRRPALAAAAAAATAAAAAAAASSGFVDASAGNQAATQSLRFAGGAAVSTGFAGSSHRQPVVGASLARPEVVSLTGVGRPGGRVRRRQSNGQHMMDELDDILQGLQAEELADEEDTAEDVDDVGDTADAGAKLWAGKTAAAAAGMGVAAAAAADVTRSAVAATPSDQQPWQQVAGQHQQRRSSSVPAGAGNSGMRFSAAPATPRVTMVVDRQRSSGVDEEQRVPRQEPQFSETPDASVPESALPPSVANEEAAAEEWDLADELEKVGAKRVTSTGFFVEHSQVQSIIDARLAKLQLAVEQSHKELQNALDRLSAAEAQKVDQDESLLERFHQEQQLRRAAEDEKETLAQELQTATARRASIATVVMEAAEEAKRDAEAQAAVVEARLLKQHDVLQEALQGLQLERDQALADNYKLGKELTAERAKVAAAGQEAELEQEVKKLQQQLVGTAQATERAQAEASQNLERAQKAEAKLTSFLQQLQAKKQARDSS